MGRDISSCAEVSEFCTDVSYGATVREFCPRTCGSCTEEAPRTTTASVPTSKPTLAPTEAPTLTTTPATTMKPSPPCADNTEGAIVVANQMGFHISDCSEIANYCT